MMWTVVEIVNVATTGLVLWGLTATLVLFVLSRRPPRPAQIPPGDLRLVFVVAALDEAKVIGPTVAHLLGLGPTAVVVVDDASTDGTGDRAREAAGGDPRLVILRRTPPDARRGKGEALNFAYRWLRRARWITGDDPDRVIVCVMDADGRLSPATLGEVLPYFGDPGVGATQISVRIRNRDRSLLALLQHFEFTAFTHLYQRARERTGAVGLGGNGQFVRLSALASLGDRPWTDCLTEDLDLGIRLLLAGWRNRYCPTVSVDQQGVTDPGRLLRQRTRWFQGALQCLGRLPEIVAHPALPLTAKLDLTITLTMPVVILAVFPVLVAKQVAVVVLAGLDHSVPLTATGLAVAYLMAFTPGVLLGYAYWLDEPRVPLWRAVALGHLFSLYVYLWFVAGLRAAARQLTGRGGWAKTAREDETVASPPVPAPLGGAAPS